MERCKAAEPAPEEICRLSANVLACPVRSSNADGALPGFSVCTSVRCHLFAFCRSTGEPVRNQDCPTLGQDHTAIDWTAPSGHRFADLCPRSLCREPCQLDRYHRSAGGCCTFSGIQGRCTRLAGDRKPSAPRSEPCSSNETLWPCEGRGMVYGAGCWKAIDWPCFRRGQVATASGYCLSDPRSSKSSLHQNCGERSKCSPL